MVYKGFSVCRFTLEMDSSTLEVFMELKTRNTVSAPNRLPRLVVTEIIMSCCLAFWGPDYGQSNIECGATTLSDVATLTSSLNSL